MTTNHVQFWFHRFRFRFFDVKMNRIVENIDIILEIVESDLHVSTISIIQETLNKKRLEPIK